MNKHLQMAIELAKESKCRTKHGCVVVNKGKVVSTATNKRVSDPSMEWRKSHIHAEAAAVIAAGRYAHNSIVYVARVMADGTTSNSKPCKKCDGYLARMGVAQIVYT